MKDEELTAAVAGGTGTGIGLGIAQMTSLVGALAFVVAVCCGAVSALLFWHVLNRDRTPLERVYE